MSREHKYKAWIFNNRMIEVKTIYFGTKKIIVKDWFGNSGIDFKDVVLLEYTGIKDYMGEEIYEGDLVMVEDYPHWEGSFKVKWNNENSMYILEDQSGDNEALYEFEKYRIIGNIYQNPELLKN
jgi:uncharacterized phage protein (TIGR01671 family)